MGSKWKSIKNADGKGGVRYREHPTRKHGAAQMDRYYCISYWWKGRSWEEAVGWASNGVKPSFAFNLLAAIKKSQKTGNGPCTLAEMRAEAEAKKAAEAAKDITLDDYWPTYFKHAKQIKKPSSWKKERSHFDVWLSPLLGAVPLRKIGMEQWDVLVETLTKAKKSVRTREYVTGTLRRILKHAYHRRLVGEPPPTGKRIGATGPGSSNRRTRVIKPDEAEALLAELEERDVHAWRLTRFAFLTGCRASEAFNLRWRDLDLGAGSLRFVETKNRDSRELPISEGLAALLAEMPEGEPADHVFTKKTGEPYVEVPWAFKTAVEELELNEGRGQRDKLTFHSIRHSVATSLAKSGLNPRDLMDTMGWRTVEMAMRYVHVNEKKKEKALASLEHAMKPREEGAKVVPLVKRGKV